MAHKIISIAIVFLFISCERIKGIWTNEEKIKDKAFVLETRKYINDFDDLFAIAARIVVINQLNSSILLERKLEIGLERAQKIINQLEEMGIIGASQEGNTKEVLYFDLESLEELMQKKGIVE
jgi:DNA segregation ATPase FtsK/SpoIIIE-like protein